MKYSVIKYLLSFVLLLLSFPAYGHKTLVFTAVEGNSSTVPIVTEVLRKAYDQLDISIEIKEYPGLRGLYYSNNGSTDGEAFRIEGIDKEFRNLIRITVPVKISDHHCFVKPGKEFVVDGWQSIPHNYIVGYQRGVKILQYSIAEHNLHADPVANATQLLYKLENGRNDVIIANALEIARKSRELQLGNVIRLEPPIQSHNIYHYLHVKHADLVPKITAILQKMETSGEIKKIQDEIMAEIDE